MSSTILDTLPRMTTAEFMNWDGAGNLGKLELVNGEVRAMSPASGTHALIQANLAGLIWQHLRATKKPCRVGTEAPVIPRLHANDNVRAPDLAVTCSEAWTGKTFPDPVLIIEILSPSSQRETWDSIMACATIPALTEIAVVDSERVRVEVHRRDAGGAWPKDPDLIAESGTVRLTTIDAPLPLAEIYAGTALASAPPA